MPLLREKRAWDWEWGKETERKRERGGRGGGDREKEKRREERREETPQEDVPSFRAKLLFHFFTRVNVPLSRQSCDSAPICTGAYMHAQRWLSWRHHWGRPCTADRMFPPPPPPFLLWLLRTVRLQRPLGLTTRMLTETDLPRAQIALFFVCFRLHASVVLLYCFTCLWPEEGVYVVCESWRQVIKERLQSQNETQSKDEAPWWWNKNKTPNLRLRGRRGRVASEDNGKHPTFYRKLALVGIIPNQILFSFNSDKDRRTDSWIRRKNSAAPPGIQPRILRIPVARSNHWATKPQRELLSLSELKEKGIWSHILFSKATPFETKTNELLSVSSMRLQMHVKQYSSLGYKPFLIALETVAEKIRIPCSHAQKILIRKLRFRKIHFRERFRKAPFWGPIVFEKLRISADTCVLVSM